MAYHSRVYFDSFDLSTIPNFKITQLGFESIPEVVISSGKLVRNHGVKLYNKEYASKPITIEGLIEANSREGFVSTRDSLLRRLEPQEATLQLPIAAQPREWTCTTQNTVFSDTGGGYGQVTINFTASDPFGYDRDTRVLLDGYSETNASEDIALIESIQGSQSTPAMITITVVAATGTTGKYISLENSNGDLIQITRTWAADDVLRLDMKNKTCTVNNVATEYTGSFWNFAVGDTTMNYTDNFTTRTSSILMTYKPRYL